LLSLETQQDSRRPSSVDAYPTQPDIIGYPGGNQHREMASQYPFQHLKIAAVLDRLHDAAKADKWKLARRATRFLWFFLNPRETDNRLMHVLFHDVYIPVSREQGALLYLIVRAINARRVVEFGSSFGISTIYLTTAVMDNMQSNPGTFGQVIGSELEPHKHAVATQNLEVAGLSDIAKILLGDAMERFQTVEAPVDLVLLDGWKELYLPVVKLLKPKLRPGAVVMSDNIFTFKRALRPFLEYMQSGKNGFVSSTLRISDGFEFSVFQGPGE
jgi:predicted O-methyltransferase YrrM